MREVEVFNKKFAEWSKKLLAGDIILLYGEVGVGKTQAVRAIVEGFGGKFVQSPTFAIHQRYKTNFLPIDHLDLYRIKNQKDLESTGFWEILNDESSITFVEWAEKLDADDLPIDRRIWLIKIQSDDGDRKIRVKEL